MTSAIRTLPSLAYSLPTTEECREGLSHCMQRTGLAFTSLMHKSSEYLVRAMIYPLTPGKYRNLDVREWEIARRVATFGIHILLAPLTLSTYVLGGLIKMVGEKLSNVPYYLIKGQPQLWDPNHFRAMTFNTCRYWGGLPDHGGGLDNAASREPSIVALIKQQNPTFLALQEESFGPGLSLAEQLKDQYAFMYTNVGASHYHGTLYSAGPEIFFASKVPVIGTPSFFPYALHSDKIGYFCVETEVAWVLSAHFPDGKQEMWPHRKALLDQVHKKMEELERNTGKKAIFMGDLNVRRTGQENDEYALSGIREKFFDPALRKYPAFNENTATCTNTFLDFRLKEGDSPYEIDDYILCSRSLEKEYDVNIQLGNTYIPHQPERSISDHRYYVCDFTRRS